MAETSGPFDGTALAEGDWELMLQHLIHGVVGAPGSTALRATASGAVARGVDLSAGTALVRGHWYRNDALLTVSSDANNASSPRVDRAVLRLDRVNNTVNAAVIEGTPSSVPQPPTPRDDASVTEVPIWRWTVTPGAGGVSSLVDERPWIGALPVPCTSASRPRNPQPGQLAHEADTGRLNLWDGSTWRMLWQPITELTLGNNDPAFWQGSTKLVREGRVAMLFAQYKRMQDWAVGDTGSHPAPTIPAGWRPWIDTGGAAELGSGNCRWEISTSGVLTVSFPDHPVPAGSQLYLSTTYFVS